MSGQRKQSDVPAKRPVFFWVLASAALLAAGGILFVVAGTKVTTRDRIVLYVSKSY